MAPAVQSEVPFVSLRFFLNNVSRFCYGPGGSIRSSICISLFFLIMYLGFVMAPAGQSEDPFVVRGDGVSFPPRTPTRTPTKCTP